MNSPSSGMCTSQNIVPIISVSKNKNKSRRCANQKSLILYLLPKGYEDTAAIKAQRSRNKLVVKSWNQHLFIFLSFKIQNILQ